MSQTIDNRGQACPQPVINTKRALDAMTSGSVVSIVDNTAAKENVSRLAKTLGCECQIEEKDGLYYLTITKNASQIMNEAQTDNVVQATVIAPSSTTTILVKSNLLGVGAEELGQILMKSFFYTLTQDEQSLPTTVIFLNTGVRLTSEGSQVLAHLQDLAAKGTEILSCGTCLDFYGLKEKLAVGRISNMYEINEKLKSAGKVITL